MKTTAFRDKAAPIVSLKYADYAVVFILSVVKTCSLVCWNTVFGCGLSIWLLIGNSGSSFVNTLMKLRVA
jgi:hypothetical protein